jgi:hypothetical protein
MYTLQFLAPVFIGLCASNFLEKQGELCNVGQPQPNMIKYYEPGYSCYVNGVFYSKCEDRPNGSI